MIATTNNFWKYVVWMALVIFPAGLHAATGADQTKPYGAISILESSDLGGVETLGNSEHDGARKRFRLPYRESAL